MRILIATNALTGHFRPLLPFADACRRAGHELLVVAPESFAPAVADAGLPHHPCADVSAEARAAAMATLSGLPPDQAATRLGVEIFSRLGPRAALPCMTDAIRTWRPHVILRETAELASLLAAEREGLPHVTVRIELAAVIDQGTRQHAAPVAQMRAEAGLPPAYEGQWLRRGPYFTLVPASLEDPTIPGSANTLRFRAPREHRRTKPPWLPPGDDPLIYLSFGTVAGMAPPYSHLYPAAINALAALPIRVVVGLGDTGDPATLGPLPPHVRVERWLPQDQAMPHAAAMVCHGGAGSVITGLAAGVPMALLPLFGDQPDNARRVAALGAGIALDGPAAIGQLPQAVRTLLHDSSYRQAAQRLAAEIDHLPPVDQAVITLETIARNVLR
ncbi:MAG: glycosyltransferase [Egibacteraceae bacterium]